MYSNNYALKINPLKCSTNAYLKFYLRNKRVLRFHGPILIVQKSNNMC